MIYRRCSAQQGAAAAAEQLDPMHRGGLLAARSGDLALAVEDLDRAFSAMVTGRAEALIAPIVNPLAFARRAEIARLAQRNRLPSIFGGREFAEAGGLMTYGPSIADGWRRAATYVDISKHVGCVNRESIVIDAVAA